MLLKQEFRHLKNVFWPHLNSAQCVHLPKVIWQLCVTVVLRGSHLICHSCTLCGPEAIFSPVEVIRPQFSKICPLNSSCHSLRASVQSLRIPLPPETHHQLTKPHTPSHLISVALVMWEHTCVHVIKTWLTRTSSLPAVFLLPERPHLPHVGYSADFPRSSEGTGQKKGALIALKWSQRNSRLSEYHPEVSGCSWG